MKCDVIARGIIAAYEEVGLSIPLVVRLEGTNVNEGMALLQQSGLPIITARGLGEVMSSLAFLFHHWLGCEEICGHHPSVIHPRTLIVSEWKNSWEWK